MGQDQESIQGREREEKMLEKGEEIQRDYGEGGKEGKEFWEDLREWDDCQRDIE